MKTDQLQVISIQGAISIGDELNTCAQAQDHTHKREGFQSGATLPPASLDQQQNTGSVFGMSVFIQPCILTFIYSITYLFVHFM